MRITKSQIWLRIIYLHFVHVRHLCPTYCFYSKTKAFYTMSFVRSWNWQLSFFSQNKNNFGKLHFLNARLTSEFVEWPRFQIFHYCSSKIGKNKLFNSQPISITFPIRSMANEDRFEPNHKEKHHEASKQIFGKSNTKSLR